MNILAIETSCDETAAAVVQDGRQILSSIVSSQMATHADTDGVVPEVAARMQLESIRPVVEHALAKSDQDWDSLDAVAVTYGPGLIGSLLVGVEFAKTIAALHAKPLISVNHLAGHVYACFVAPGGPIATHTNLANDFQFPYLALIVSGGHTELVLMRNHGQFEILGSTRDDAAGEAFDKVARLLGLPYPGGPPISKLAESGNDSAIRFPRAMLDQDNFDFSYSGLKAAVRREVLENGLAGTRGADIAASFQAAAIEQLVVKTVRATEKYQPAAVLLGGGVAANTLLRHELESALRSSNTPLLASPLTLTTDNAAMIGLAAYWLRDQVAITAALTADANASIGQ